MSQKLQKDLLLSLNKLRKRLNYNSLNPDNQSIGPLIDAYEDFINRSEYKENCTYAIKIKDFFLKLDYNDIRQELLEVLEIIKTIEGKEFGSGCAEEKRD